MDVFSGSENSVTYDIHPALVKIAGQMETYADTARTKSGTVYQVHRCKECTGVVVPADLEGRLAHLMLEHGWRMNGKRYDNHNVLQEELPEWQS